MNDSSNSSQASPVNPSGVTPDVSEPQTSAAVPPAAEGGNPGLKIICPDCDGKGQSYAHFNRGDKGHEFGWFQCRRCGGNGLISGDLANRILEGERRRLDRIGRCLSLREEAERLGITPRQLSDMEHGRGTSK